ncbi:MAG: acetylglutamate kinase [Thermoplasmatota archaeon]
MTRPALLLKLGGAVCAQPGIAARLAQAYRGQDCLIVHGGGPQLDQALASLEGEPERIDGLRVTSPAAADVVRGSLDLVGADLAARLRAHGVNAQHVGAGQELFAAQTKRRRGRDLGRVGTVTAVRTDALPDAPQKAPGAPEASPGRVLVVTPVGWDAQGPLNVNADEAAAQLAISLQAQRLCLVTDVDGVRRGGQVVPELDPQDARRFMSDGVAQGGMLPKLENALEALLGGVAAVTIGDLEAAASRPGTRGTTLGPVLPLLEATA